MDRAVAEPDLRVIQAVYAVIMALGFRAIVESGYSFASPVFGLSTSPLKPLAYVLPAVATVFLGLRFFWAVVNVRRYLERVREWVGREPDAKRAERIRRRAERLTIAVHVTVLIAHGLLFYFACKLAADIMVRESVESLSRGFVLFYAGFQVINVIWLIWLLSARRELLRKPLQREHVWILNNLVSSAIGAAAVFYFASLGVETAVAIACAIFIASSVVDLWLTSHHYLESPEARTKA